MNFYSTILLIIINLLFCKCFTIRGKRAAVVGADRIWPNKTVPFMISENFGDEIIKTIQKSMSIWENNTCIRFLDCKEKCDDFDNYAFFVPTTGICGSKIGKIAYLHEQKVYLDENGCNSVNTILHEIGHLLGFFHEHSRFDRDKYIKILHENIGSEFIDQFDKDDESEINGTILLPYDFESIMHYQKDEFSENGKDTIEFLDDKVNIDKIGKYGLLSKLNIKETLSLYNCEENEVKIDNIYKIERKFWNSLFINVKKDISEMAKGIRSKLGLFTKSAVESLAKSKPIKFITGIGWPKI